jgi:hypothetical protein
VVIPNQSLEDLVHIVNPLLRTPLLVAHPVCSTLSPDNGRIKIVIDLPSLTFWKPRERPEEIIEGTILHLHLLHLSEREHRVRPQGVPIRLNKTRSITVHLLSGLTNSIRATLIKNVDDFRGVVGRVEGHLEEEETGAGRSPIASRVPTPLHVVPGHRGIPESDIAARSLQATLTGNIAIDRLLAIPFTQLVQDFQRPRVRARELTQQ